jgi:glycosyltransferase involved in cell wall biosynthesis
MHTMYEQYTHYLPLDSAVLKRFLIHLAAGYANLCDHVIAPGRSVAELLGRRGVTTPVTVVPTGVRAAEFSRGAGREFRKAAGIPSGAFVAGTVGRIAAEKNFDFLLPAVAGFLERDPGAHFLVAGTGPLSGAVADFFRRPGMRGRFHYAGALRGRKLSAAYHAMDVFAFASLSETQGLVLAEAMAAGVPVVAIDAPGARDIVEDRVNGRLLSAPRTEQFAGALAWVSSLEPARRAALREACRKTSSRFSSRRSASKVLEVYGRAKEGCGRCAKPDRAAARVRELVRAEWLLMLNMIRSAGRAVLNKASG